MSETGAIGAATTAVLAAADADVICGQDPRASYAFCAPKKAGGDFYIGIVPNDLRHPSNDLPFIKGLFGTPACRPEPTAASPDGAPFAPGVRAYRVSSCLTRFVFDNAAKEATRIGPNCYGTALGAAGYERLRDRYVDTAEFEYYLRRDFTPASCASAHPFGTVVVYDRRPSAFDAGDHAAFELPGGLVLHKGAWKTNYPWEIVAMNGAMQAILAHYVPTGNERFEPKPDPADYEGYATACYAQKSGLRSRATSSTKRDRAWFRPLMDYYARRLGAASQLAWGEFRAKRVDLLTVENMNRIRREFSERVGNADPVKVLLSIDDGIAESYLELHSLGWQYSAMADIYAPVSDRHRKEELEELYRMHYVTFDRNFEEELALYFGLLGVPQASREAVRKDFIARLKKYDPVKYAPSDGAEGIPYLEELTKAIQAIVKSWKPPTY